MARPKRKAVDNTEQRAKRAKGETDLANDLRWTNVGSDKSGDPLLLCLSSDTLDGRQKVAGFDIDFTVIKTASGRKFAVGSNDWEFWHEKVPEKLRSLNKDGYRVVFFTNQAGIEKKKVLPDTFKTKAEAIIAEIGIPVVVLASTGINQYRKPFTDMWEHLEQSCNNGVKVDRSQSIYVGDAAGRAKNWAPDKPKDFSCSDRMFAANVGTKFATPEEFFLGESAVPFCWGSVDPDEILKKTPAIRRANDKASYSQKHQELVVMVGPPASGKSTFRQRYFEPFGYVTVNRDTLGTMAKCLKVAKQALQNGKSVVIDNTNPSKNGRADFVDLAKDRGCPCRCVVMKTPLPLAHHLNYFRLRQTEGEVRRVPDVGYNVFKKNYEEPSKSEGFSEIVQIDFKPCFDSVKDETLFKKWTAV